MMLTFFGDIIRYSSRASAVLVLFIFLGKVSLADPGEVRRSPTNAVLINQLINSFLKSSFSSSDFTAPPSLNCWNLQKMSYYRRCCKGKGYIKCSSISKMWHWLKSYCNFSGLGNFGFVVELHLEVFDTNRATPSGLE